MDKASFFAKIIAGGFIMYQEREEVQYFHEYFAEWMALYKQGAVKRVTYQKYQMTLRRLKEIAPHLKLEELNKRSYQILLNNYALTHERQTTMDFHHQLKSAILDAVDEGLVPVDPTRKVVIKGKEPSQKKPKFLNQHELQSLLSILNLSDETNWDWFILLIAKTGLRFSEALALTPQDFDFTEKKVKITKTWNYKNTEGGFSTTKNLSSKRIIQLDTKLCHQFAKLTENMEADKLIFVKGRIFNSLVNKYLTELCEKAGVPVISLHGLRHTHASLLIFAGVSIASIAKRLGHSNMTTTQKTYLHIIKELENKDNDKITQHLSTLG